MNQRAYSPNSWLEMGRLGAITGGLACLLLIMTAGCPLPTDTLPPTDGMVSYGRDVQAIFDAKCVSCHQPTGFAALTGIPLDLRAEESFASLTDGASVQRSDLPFVVAGDPEASFLFDKVDTGSPIVGSQMPIGASLTDAEREIIRQWIADGAMDN